MERTEVLGISFDNITLNQAVARASDWLSLCGFHYVVTPNPEFILQGQSDPEFAQILNGADLVLPDGIGVIYSAKILGTPLQERVPGIDFASLLLRELDSVGGSLFLLGAKEGVATLAGENIRAQYPNITIAGVHHGYFKEPQDSEIATRVEQSGADVIFACLGAPRQEQFISKWGTTMGVKIAVGLGGAMDVFAGTVERAPEWWQQHHLEWLYRLKKEPWRWKRMAKLPKVLVQAGRFRLFGKKT